MRLATIHLLLLGVISGVILSGCGNSPPKPSSTASNVNGATDQATAPETPAKTSPQKAASAQQPAKTPPAEKSAVKLVAQAEPKSPSDLAEAGQSRSKLALPTGDESTSVLVVEAIAPKRNQKDQPYAYEIRLQNISDRSHRNVAISNLRVTQQVPSSMTIRSTDLSVQTAEGKTPKGRRNQNSLSADAGEGAQATWTFSLLEPGETAVIKVTAAGGQRGQLVKYLGVNYDPLLRVQTEITEPEIHLTKKGPGIVENSMRVQLSYALRNDGNQAVKNLTVQDKLPAGIKATKVQERLPEGVRSASGPKDTLSFLVDRLGGGEKKEWTIECEAADVRTYTFEPAVATGAEGRWAQSEAVTVPIRQGKLQVEAQADRATQFTGQKLIYTISVKNIGDAKVDAPQLAANLGKGALQDTLKPAPSSGTSWKLSALEPGKTSPPITIAVRSNTPGPLESSFEASFDCEGDLKKNKKLVTSDIKSLGLDVTVESSDRTVQAGQMFICLVKLSNSGASPDSDVKLAVSLPEFVAFDGFVDSDTSAKPDAKARQVALPTIGQLEPGQKKTWRLRVKALREGSGVFAAHATSKALGSAIAFESDQVVAKAAPKPAPTKPDGVKPASEKDQKAKRAEKAEPLSAPTPRK